MSSEYSKYMQNLMMICNTICMKVLHYFSKHNPVKCSNSAPGTARTGHPECGGKGRILCHLHQIFNHRFKGFLSVEKSLKIRGKQRKKARETVFQVFFIKGSHHGFFYFTLGKLLSSRIRN